MSWIHDATFIAGLLLLSGGVALIYVPGGLIAAGVVLLALAAASMRAIARPPGDE